MEDPIINAADTFSGNWTEQLKSAINFALKDGFVTGRYETITTDNNLARKRDIFGTYQVVPKGLLITFAVHWNTDGQAATMTWVGRYHLNNPTVFNAMWIMQGDMGIAQGDIASSGSKLGINMGIDHFKR